MLKPIIMMKIIGTCSSSVHDNVIAVIDKASSNGEADAGARACHDRGKGLGIHVCILWLKVWVSVSWLPEAILRGNVLFDKSINR